jgi:hypothetical protein
MIVIRTCARYSSYTLAFSESRKGFALDEKSNFTHKQNTPTTQTVHTCWWQDICISIYAWILTSWNAAKNFESPPIESPPTGEWPCPCECPCECPWEWECECECPWSWPWSPSPPLNLRTVTYQRWCHIHELAHNSQNKHSHGFRHSEMRS